MTKKKHDCYNCIFREKIIGDAHSKCNNEWSKEDFKGKTKTLTATWNQWSIGFPNNFDPVWIKKCSKFSEIKFNKMLNEQESNNDKSSISDSFLDKDAWDALNEDEGGGSYCCKKRMVLAPSEIVYECLKCGNWEYSSS